MRKSTQLRASMRGSALQIVQTHIPIKTFLELDVSELSEISGVSEVLKPVLTSAKSAKTAQRNALKCNGT